jgi:hypothetical protein
MAEELLDCPNVVAPFQKIRRKGMPKGVAGGAFGESGFSDRASHCFLDDGFMGMIRITDLMNYPAAELTGYQNSSNCTCWLFFEAKLRGIYPKRLGIP